ncbi:MAG TPA: hypothetical protein PLZ84_09310, partial [Clostridia bacterium]|nr:hypothetical protein [Clostridia bacterium]
SIIAVGASNELGTGDFASLTSYGLKDSIICAFDKATGQMKWMKSYGSEKHDMFNVIKTEGESLIVGGSYEQNTSLYKLDGNGNIIWRARLSDADFEVEDVLALEDKYIVIASNYMFSVSLDGQLIKKQRFPVLFRGLVKTASGFTAVGSTESEVNLADFIYLLPENTTDTSVYKNHGSMDGFIALFDDDAQILDFRFWGGEGADGFYGAVAAADGNGIVAVGYAGFSSFGNGALEDHDAVSVKANGVAVRFDGLTPKYAKVFANTETSDTYLYRVTGYGSGYAIIGTDKSTDDPSENEVFERVKGTDAIVLFFDDASKGFN